jgi:sphinganine-1-phosphate aldolase
VSGCGAGAQTAAEFAAGVREMPELRLAGEPAMAVVAFAAAAPARGAARLDVYRLNDALGARGWHLNALQRPPALHMCFTAAHTSAQPLLRASARRTSACPSAACPACGGKNCTALRS